ncbi:MAG TPA: HPr family phosphocarrier protein [Candidatus Sulfotelmatobacter sp.]|nr:HPr family phosphocarrier protein [Candidatus Sulfotelmatobacter sp.]
MITLRDVTLTVTNEVGLHARPAALFVKAASRYPDTRVEIIKDGTAQNAKSILGVLTLQVTQGTTILVRADGPHAEDVLSALQSLVARDFGG